MESLTYAGLSLLGLRQVYDKIYDLENSVKELGKIDQTVYPSYILYDSGLRDALGRAIIYAKNCRTGLIEFKGDALIVLNGVRDAVPENATIMFRHGDYILSSRFTSSKKLRFIGEGSGTRLLPSGSFDAIDPSNLSLLNIVWRDRYGVDNDASFDLTYPSLTSKNLLDKLLEKYKVIRVPTNVGWYSSHVGSGSAIVEPLRHYLYTGTTASSRAMLWTYIFGLNSGNLFDIYIDWRKRLEFEFMLARERSDSECSARVQLKESASEGILAQRGIGVSIANYTMTGEAYGTARGTVSLGTLTNERLARIKIVKTDTEVQFWVNGVLVGTLTGTAVPSVEGTSEAYMVISIINGTTGGVNAVFIVGNFIIVQEW
jgi:hypothetical protein